MFAKNEIPSDRPFIKCCDCDDRAIIGLYTGFVKNKQWVYNKSPVGVCLRHYESRKLNKAKDWNRKMGLDSVKKQKDYVFKTPFKFKKV
jgi:hypothetical protein